jgi:Reverse transcriptase (RNA-dependent DNA polymerase)
VHWRNRALWQYYFQYNRPHCRVLANDIAPKSMPIHRLHGARHGPIPVGYQPHGLTGLHASFQRLMEAVVNGLTNVIVYIDDLLIHSATHQEHITALDNVLQRLVQHNIKINLQKCFFGSKEVS